MENMANNEKVTRKDLFDLEERLTKKLVSKEKFEQKMADLATKKELGQEEAKLATREAVNVLANQIAKNTLDIAEIRSDIKKITRRLDAMQDRIEKLEEKIDRLDEKLDNKFNRVLKAVDSVLREITNTRTEKSALDHALIRHDDRFEDHEKRIRKLEKQVA